MKIFNNTKKRDFGCNDRNLFNIIAYQYTRKDLEITSKIVRKHRLQATVGKLPLENSRILEVGCGGGFTTRYLDGNYKEYVGIDYSEALINYAKENNVISNADSFFVADIREYQPAEQFEVILMIGVLHHFDDLYGCLAKIRKLLKPGGIIIANEPQSSNRLINFVRIVRKKIDRKYSSDQVYFSPAEIKSAYELSGFVEVCIKAQGILSPPFAEVIFVPSWLFKQIALAALKIDAFFERLIGSKLLSFSWNLIAIGRNPYTTKTNS